MAALTNPKHEKFCMVWHETGNKSEAYRESHPRSLKWKDVTVHNKSYELSKKGEILVRFGELQDKALESHGVTIESLLRELDEARDMALLEKNSHTSAAITATMSKAKLVGLDINKSEVNVTTSNADEWADE